MIKDDYAKTKLLMFRNIIIIMKIKLGEFRKHQRADYFPQVVKEAQSFCISSGAKERRNIFNSWGKRGQVCFLHSCDSDARLLS